MAAPTQCYKLDGTGDYISLADNAGFDVTSAVSIGAWVYRDYDDLDTVSYILARASSYELYINADNEPEFTISGATTLVAHGYKIPAESPMFIVGVAYEDGTTLYMEIYLNGVRVANTSLTAALPAANANDLYIGSDSTPGSDLLKGTISSIFMTSDQVTATEVKTIYDHSSGQATGNVDNLVIDIDTEGDLVNAGSAGNGTGQGNAAARTYLGFWQSIEKNGGTFVAPEAETGYLTHNRVVVKRIHWEGENITDGDNLRLQDYSGRTRYHFHAVAADTGTVREFGGDVGEVWIGFQVSLLDNGKLEVEIG